MVRWRARLQQWNFPAGASVSFAHLEHDKTVLNWQGSQIPLTCFDELTHFSAKQLPMRSVEYATSSSTDIEEVLALARPVVHDRGAALAVPRAGLAGRVGCVARVLAWMPIR